jgi:hypothetical protein
LQKLAKTFRKTAKEQQKKFLHKNFITYHKLSIFFARITRKALFTYPEHFTSDKTSFTGNIIEYRALVSGSD